MNLISKRRAAALPFLFLSALLPLTAMAQTGSERVVKAKGYISTTAVKPGDKFKIAVVLEVASGYHINAHVPSLDYLVPTTVEFQAPPGITVREATYPEPEHKSFDFAPDTKLAVYEGSVVITAAAEVSPSAKPGAITIPARVKVQSCNNSLCLAPSDLVVEIPVQVVSKGTSVQAANAEVFSGSALRPPPAESNSAGAPQLQQFKGSGQKKDDLGDLIAASGLPLALLTVFVSGLLLNLTPCVYPIIPITIGFFVHQAGAEGKPRLRHTFLMAGMYTIGMAITYSVLGVVASVTGGLFGAALQNPIVPVGLAALMVGLSLSMFGVYEFRVPRFLNRFANKSTQSTSGAVGALVMGLTMGIVAAPCIGPFVLGLLVHVSTKADPVYGFFIFFVLALGLGLPYLILGTFTGAIKALPRSGEWMITVRKVLGLALIGMALYFLAPLIPSYKDYLYVAFFATSALYLIFWESVKSNKQAFAWILRAIGVAAAAVAVMIVWPKRAEAEMAWQPYSEHAVAAAQREGKAVMIDVFADWCIPCKELDERTFTDPAVKKEAERFVALKLNLTTSDANSEAGRARKRFDIIGVPTVILLDASGREDETTRLTGFEKPSDFVARLKRVSSAQPAPGSEVASKPPSDRAVVADAAPGAYEMAPSVSMKLLEGGKIDMESLRGKVVLLDFWATWCVPCLSEIPMFNELSKAHKVAGLELIGVSLDDEGAAKVKPFVKIHPMAYTKVVGDDKIAESFKVVPDSLPIAILVDKEGRIRFTHKGIVKKETLEEQITRLLAE